jgi:glycine dehydrogenase
MKTHSAFDSLPFNPQTLPRELCRHYVSASDQDLNEMLEAVGKKDLADLYAHIPEALRFSEPLDLPAELSYEALAERMQSLSDANHIVPSFIGDGLPAFSQHEIVDYVCGIRNLTTAYTPYQPERSQGTLYTHWVYQSLMAQLTGFEAINSSLYDRSSALFEAICVAVRLKTNATKALVPLALYPGDHEVIRTLAKDTAIELIETPLDPQTGTIDFAALEAEIAKQGAQIAALVFPQVNTLGILEDVDKLTDFCAAHQLRSIAVVDPLLLAKGGLKTPANFGKKGADMLVGEAQHLALLPNFGGPGLGLFGIRFNAQQRNDIRQTPGRFVGKAFDLKGRECRVMVLSTREQHIRKEKATSNICSNQAFIATLVGAALLARGESGLESMLSSARARLTQFLAELPSIQGARAAFARQTAFIELTLELSIPADDFLKKARLAGINAGVDASERISGNRSLLKLSFSDLQTEADVTKLIELLNALPALKPTVTADFEPIPQEAFRAEAPHLPELPLAEVKAWYDALGELNASPDDGPYPLGSCTMKYNPWINDWAAGLSGFTQLHPQAPEADSQGALEVLFETQEYFKKITGLAGVTTQPLAGAQGELVGIKLFQAYHRHNGDTQRNVILIPKSAHGTNFATASMAGFESGVVHGQKTGIILLEANEHGLISRADFDEKIELYGPRIAGIMITNPNTSGLFETDFRYFADRIHAVGGLVYMDGANMNAIAGWLNLGAMGVDAVHNNLHKTWTIPHGGGGPGDAIVAVSEKLVDFLPGHQVIREGNQFRAVKPSLSIGSFHRHWGNFAHKLRALSYLYRLGNEGVSRVTAIAVLSARYLYQQLKTTYASLPEGATEQPRMHEFILTLKPETFDRIEAAGVPRAAIIARIGKLFLDFGFHAPTVAWPETFGLMIEPTESYTRSELDRFAEAVAAIHGLIETHPAVLNKVPLFTPVDRIDDVTANRNLCLHEPIQSLPLLNGNRFSLRELHQLPVQEIRDRIIRAAGC